MEWDHKCRYIIVSTKSKENAKIQINTDQFPFSNNQSSSITEPKLNPYQNGHTRTDQLPCGLPLVPCFFFFFFFLLVESRCSLLDIGGDD